MDNAKGGYALPYNDSILCRSASLLHAATASQRRRISADPEIVAARENLPIFKRKSELTRVLIKNQIVVVIGETGSGKTTQIPQYLKEIGYGSRGRIGCTQLRRVAAKAVANRVAREQGCALGEEVGYTIRFEDCTSARTQIQFMTDGILLRECERDRLLSSYSAIILDESHERTVDTDVLLSVLRWICQQRKDLKLILSSATLDSAKFSSFFFDATIFSITGRTYPVQIIYGRQVSTTYIERAARRIERIDRTEAEGDIMVFMTGERDIAELCDIIKSWPDHSSRNRLIVLPCHSTLPWEDQEKIFQPAERGTRKIIVTTNIAETSLTIDGVRYVIDSGWVKQKVYDFQKEIETLQTVQVSKAQAVQRAGRAGRVAPGKCYRLYLKSEFESFAPRPVPQIKRSNLTSAILLLKRMGFCDLKVLKFIDRPPRKLVQEAETELKLIGAVDAVGRITDLGKELGSFPVDPNLAKMLLKSVELNCSEEILTIVAMLSVANIFIRPPERKKREADTAKENFLSKDGDLMTMLNVYKAWLDNGKNPRWCRNNFVHNRLLREADQIRDQLYGLMGTRGMTVKSAGTRTRNILKSIASGFTQNVAQRRASIHPSRDAFMYLTLAKREPVYIFPGSALFRIAPDWVVYQKVVETKKSYMHGVTPVDPRWIKKFAPSIYGNRLEPLRDDLYQLIADLSDL